MSKLILLISIAMALFLPAMVTLYLFYPIAVLSYISYLIMKEKPPTVISSNIILIILGTVLTFGMPYLISFLLFINIFPTYVVILMTLIIMTLLPLKSYSKTIKITIFLSISTIIGLNTNIPLLVKKSIGQDRVVDRVFNKILEIDDKEFIEIKSNIEKFPYSYNKFEFITFGFNEGCMCGYWKFPYINKSETISNFLEKNEIPYSKIKLSNKKIVIEYKKEKNFYNLKIEVIYNQKILSSLSIKDYLPFQAKKDINNNTLNSFYYRLEYLLRHNIWNTILHLNIDKEENREEILNFLKQALKLSPQNINLKEKTIDINATLVKSSEMSTCSQKSEDNSKDYEYNQWLSVYTSPFPIISNHPARFIFKDNNITYTTLSHLTKFSLHDKDISLKFGKYLYVIKKVYKNPLQVILWKFTQKGKLIDKLNIKLPKDIKIGTKKENPISHLEITDDKITFRINNIYNYKGQKSSCNYSLIEIKTK